MIYDRDVATSVASRSSVTPTSLSQRSTSRSQIFETKNYAHISRTTYIYVSIL